MCSHIYCRSTTLPQQLATARDPISVWLLVAWFWCGCAKGSCRNLGVSTAFKLWNVISAQPVFEVLGAFLGEVTNWGYSAVSLWSPIRRHPQCHFEAPRNGRENCQEFHEYFEESQRVLRQSSASRFLFAPKVYSSMAIIVFPGKLYHVFPQWTYCCRTRRAQDGDSFESFPPSETSTEAEYRSDDSIKKARAYRCLGNAVCLLGQRELISCTWPYPSFPLLVVLCFQSYV